jgi:hypothetical protein
MRQSLHVRILLPGGLVDSVKGYGFILTLLFSENLSQNRYHFKQITDDAVIEIDGRRLYLAHGDRLNPDDFLYRFWRGLLRHRITLKLIDLAPTGLTLKIADFLSTDNKIVPNRKKFIPPQIFRSLKHCAPHVCRPLCVPLKL